MNVHTTPVFPSLIHQIKLPCFDLIVDSLAKDILEYRDNNSGVEKSNMGGYQSDDKFLKTKKFEEYFEYIDLNITTAIESFYDDGIDYGNAWFNINSNENYNWPHNHPGAVFSCVLWVKIPKNPGPICFQNHTCKTANDLISVNLKKDLKEGYNASTQMYFTPEVGNIIIFPGYLEHHVEPTKDSKNDRISIALNYS